MHDVPFRIKSVQKYEQRTSQLRNKGWYFIVAPPPVSHGKNAE